ncbi:PTS sugar transporter subunit IIA [Loigolactobacillus iwatensis]|uniref:PTS sugar transporter subunit IIA n=1 Tax=Loigolactobacillus iwatensis TaxID=1267156 RepID=UPI000F7D79EA|nr:PTS sugar transporter subunit IIA [Loigolactobacillus iwatensis]
MSLIHPELIFQNKSFENNESALYFLADKLYVNKFVKSTFKDAVVDREGKFPTGLPTGKISVAIPHADSAHVIKSALGVMTLDSPIKFHNMGDPDSKLDVSLIIMLAIGEPHGQITMLQKLMGIVQDQKHLEQILAYEDKDSLYKDLHHTFKDIKV